LKSKATIRYLSIFVTTKMINEVGTVAKSSRQIVAIEANPRPAHFSGWVEAFQ